jgi:hypothetical protein
VLYIRKSAFPRGSAWPEELRVTVDAVQTTRLSKAINMSANCATWTSERIELLKRARRPPRIDMGEGDANRPPHNQNCREIMPV